MTIQKTAEYYLRTQVGISTKDCLALVLKEHPGAGTKDASINWYRNKLVNEGKLVAKSKSKSKFDDKIAELDRQLAESNAKLAALEAKK